MEMLGICNVLLNSNIFSYHNNLVALSVRQSIVEAERQLLILEFLTIAILSQKSSLL